MRTGAPRAQQARLPFRCCYEFLEMHAACLLCTLKQTIYVQSQTLMRTCRWLLNVCGVQRHVAGRFCSGVQARRWTSTGTWLCDGCCPGKHFLANSPKLLSLHSLARWVSVKSRRRLQKTSSVQQWTCCIVCISYSELRRSLHQLLYLGAQVVSLKPG